MHCTVYTDASYTDALYIIMMTASYTDVYDARDFSVTQHQWEKQQ